MLWTYIRNHASGFRFRLILGLVLVMAVVEVLSVLSLRAREEEKFEAELESQSGLVADTVAELFATPLWDFNYEVLRSMVEGLESKPDILHVHLFDPDGAEIARAGPHENDGLRLTRDIYYGPPELQQFIGEVRIDFDTSEIAARLQDSLRGQIISSVLLLAALLVPLVLLLDHFLRPLSHLVRATGRLREGDIDAPVPYQNRLDELGALAAALEQLRQTEAEMRRIRADADTHNRTERRRMLRALTAASDAVLVFDEANRITFRNPKAETLLGGFHPDAVLPPVDMETSLEQHLALDVAGTGSPRNIRLRVDPIRDEEGRILGRVLLATDETGQVRARQEAEFNARHDMLTGLANRRYLEEKLQEATVRGQDDVALLIADLDHFKSVNDRLGHVVGDALLREVAGLLRDVVRPVDTPFRMGGDEFAILATGPGAAQRVDDYAAALLDRLTGSIRIGARDLRTGLSGGIARYGGRSCANLSQIPDLIQHADIALYEAKRRGGQAIVAFRRDLEAEVRRRAMIEDTLKHALETGEGLTSVYQPQTDLRTREVTGFEALARLVDAEGKPIPPAEFIPVAEDACLIAALTARIVVEAMRFARSVRQTGFPGRVAVNISPRLFAMDLPDLLETARALAGCEPDLIELEITEQIVLSEELGAEAQIDLLRARGFRVALDDFGVGFSSFNYLQRFNFDKIKIDRSFAAQAKHSAKARKIIAAITEMGHALGAQVVAEGVETDADVAALLATDIDTVQGWIDGRPKAARDFQALIAAPDWWRDAEALRSA